MPVLVTCKFDEELIKIEGTIEYELFHHSMAINSEVNSPIWPEIGFVRDFMAVLVTCNFEEVPIKREVAILRTTFSPLSVYGKIFRHSSASKSKPNSPISPKLELRCDFMPFKSIENGHFRAFSLKTFSES